MGGGKGGNYGNTKGSRTTYKEILDAASNVLAAASLIPGVDTITDLVSIPVDALRGDYVSAGLDLIGAIPVVGEIADTAKIADKAVDVAKAVDKVKSVGKTAQRSTKGTRLLSQVSNSKLSNTIKEMYRPGAKVGDGGLADAIRYEIKTKKLVGGKSHLQKGTERLTNLKNIIKKENLSAQDKKIAESLIKDLEKALGEK